jgi:hypothetical protein
MPDLERVQKSTPLTLTQTWTEDGVAVEPGTVTVGITRADGTELVAPGTATTAGGTGVRTFNLTTTHTALLDRLTVTWTSTLKGTLTSYVEVVGGFLFSIADARAVTPLNNTTTYPTAAIVAMRILVEQSLEDACGVAFVPRYTYETLNGYGATTLQTSWAKTTAIRSVSFDGVALDSTALGTVAPSPSGSLLYYPVGWTAGFSNVTIGYEHGHPVTPERVKRAAIRLAKRWLVEGPVDDRATTFSNDDGTYSLVTPGRRGEFFDLPEVNAVVQQYGLTVGVA